MTELWAVALIVFGTFIGSFGSVYLKKGSNKLEFRMGSILRNWEIFLGLGLFVFSSVFFIVGLKGGELSVLYPLVSVSYIWITVLSMKMLNERVNRSKLLGILFIIAGVTLIGLGS